MIRLINFHGSAIPFVARYRTAVLAAFYARSRRPCLLTEEMPGWTTGMNFVHCPLINSVFLFSVCRSASISFSLLPITIISFFRGAVTFHIQTVTTGLLSSRERTGRWPLCGVHFIEHAADHNKLSVCLSLSVCLCLSLCLSVSVSVSLSLSLSLGR